MNNMTIAIGMSIPSFVRFFTFAVQRWVPCFGIGRSGVVLVSEFATSQATREE
jgi:hypothetical protein